MAKSNAVGTKLMVNGKQVGALKEIEGIEVTAESIDVTDFDNTSGYRDKIPGFKEVGELTCSGFLDGDDAGQAECYDLLISGDTVACSIIFPAKIGKTWSFNAAVSGFKTGASVDDAITFELTLTVTGTPTFENTDVSG